MSIRHILLWPFYFIHLLDDSQVLTLEFIHGYQENLNQNLRYITVSILKNSQLQLYKGELWIGEEKSTWQQIYVRNFIPCTVGFIGLLMCVSILLLMLVQKGIQRINKYRKYFTRYIQCNHCRKTMRRENRKVGKLEFKKMLPENDNKPKIVVDRNKTRLHYHL